MHLWLIDLPAGSSLSLWVRPSKCLGLEPKWLWPLWNSKSALPTRSCLHSTSGVSWGSWEWTFFKNQQLSVLFCFECTFLCVVSPGKQFFFADLAFRGRFVAISCGQIFGLHVGFAGMVSALKRRHELRFFRWCCFLLVSGCVFLYEFMYWIPGVFFRRFRGFFLPLALSLPPSFSSFCPSSFLGLARVLFFASVAPPPGLPWSAAGRNA